MAIYDSSKIVDSRYLFSQTPPDFVEENYFLNSTQMKIDADWPYRPNRKNIEYETAPGSEEYKPLEVVVQSVHGEKGQKVSDDWYALVFRDCSRFNRLGSRYRFDLRDGVIGDFSEANIWMGLNQTSLSPTSSQVVCRCNGTIGSIWKAPDGKLSYHYEPVIQVSDINRAGFFYSEIAVDMEGKLTIIAQYNKYTQQYYLNQRFVIGNRQIWKVVGIYESDTLSTNDPKDIGVIRLHLEVDQVGDKDDMERRIAYNGVEETPVPISPAEPAEDNYVLTFAEPDGFPETFSELTIRPVVLNNSVETAIGVATVFSLTGRYASKANIANYVKLTDNEDGSWTITKLRSDVTLSLKIECSATVDSKNLENTVELRLI